ncbi:hypothetical protein VCSRO192_3344 [Vibrio cholerae]|nr:putative O-antigen polymerase [Vibrio cholerae]GHW16631.1 hypothetical protein VCSRO192_3344 [Vibrio cholerae]
MVYLFVLLFCSLYLHAIRNYRVNFLLLFPPFTIYVLVSALQYNVGTDYFSYIEIYNTPSLLARYLDTREYSFYYINMVLSYLKAPPQTLFFIFSLLQSIFIFFFLVKAKNKEFTVWILFFIFFTVTNIYNNQLNLIRQYAALTLIPILSMYLCDKRYFSFVVGCFIATSFHSSGILFFGFLIFILLYKLVRNYTFFIFVLTLPLYFYLTKYVSFFLDLLSLNYAYYVEGQNVDAGSFSSVVTKLYYLPAILLFYYVYYRDNFFNPKIKGDGYFPIMIFIFSCTYWSFVMSLEIGMLSRLSTYFWFFIIFPLYYVAIYFEQKNKRLFYMYLMYLLLPYATKVTFLARNEFIYKSYLFN